MRGAASLLVLLMHIAVKGSQYGNGALKGFSAGGTGVDLFFIISGYVMCISTYDQPLNFGQFIVRRIKRIVPLYWLMTTAALMVYLYNSKLINTSGGETGILASYTLYPNGKKFLNANGWTLSYEFFFYFIFGSFINKGTDRAVRASSLILLTLVMIGVCFDFKEPLIIFSTNSLLIEFVFGMGCFYLVNQKKVQLSFKYGVALFLSGLFLFSLQILFGNPDNGKWIGMLWGITMLSIVIGLLLLEDMVQRSFFTGKDLFLEIGNSSYSLYLTHPFVLSATAMGLRHFGMASNPYLFTVILFVFSIAAGYFVYLYLERPLTSWMKKISGTP
jgi:exopolysaccharide production protein ExoZ